MDAVFLTYLFSLFLIIFIAKLFQCTVRFFALFTGSMAPCFSDWCTADCKAHTNIADELVCLMVSNIWNDVVAIHRSQEV
jgi:DNA-binding helix-hairpin-helix protein with protein kinase domain